MTGPTAPKDPTAKRSGFYIMRNKQISGSVQPDGTGVQFIYLDGGRLLSSAKLVGNIADETMIEMLKSTEGFRELVHSIGISVTLEDSEQKVDFVLQMYGKKDIYGSGTQLKIPVQGNRMEHVLSFDDIIWSEEDNVPGQIRFEFFTSGTLAMVDVKLYLQDGFVAPEVELEEPVDTNTLKYQEMIRKSFLQCGNNKRLKEKLEKAKKGEEITLAFIGGSITQGAGATPIHTGCYAYQTYEKLCELVGDKNKNNIRYLKAGVGGTPSELGMIRYERDVLRDGKETPDIIIIEFAVNDAGDETNGECYESLVRKILFAKNEPAVILLFSVFANDWNLEDRLIPIGTRYDLPMVSIKKAVVEQFYEKSLDKKVVSKNQFFYDMYHPTNIGHTIMADCLKYLFQQIDIVEKSSEYNVQQILPILGDEFENIQLLDRETIGVDATIECGDFSHWDEVLQGVEMDMNLEPTKQFPCNWMHIKGGKPFTLRITCSALVMVYKDSGDPMAGKTKVLVDGAEVLIADPHINGWNHCNPVILFRKKELKEHCVTIQMVDEDQEKMFSILGFGYVNDSK